MVFDFKKEFDCVKSVGLMRKLGMKLGKHEYRYNSVTFLLT